MSGAPPRSLPEALARARASLAQPPRGEVDRFVVTAERLNHVEGAAIGAGVIGPQDLYVAYQLLEQFVAEIERLHAAHREDIALVERLRQLARLALADRAGPV